MGLGPGAAKSEGELMLQVPATNQPGVFPRDVLAPGERVLFETRPGFFALYWGRVVLAILLLLLFAAPAGQPGYVEDPFFGIFEGLFVLIIVLAIWQWRNTAYALTNQRILVVGGLRRTHLMDAFYTQVENLVLERGLSGGLRFDARSYVGTGGPLVRKIRWIGLSDPLRVYSFVQRAFAYYTRPAVVAPSIPGPGDLISCPHCQTVVDRRQLDPTAPRCPRCGAAFPRVVGPA